MQKNIVLLHGWGASTEKLRPLEDQLKKLGWKTLLVRFPGFDLKPPRKPWVLDDYVDYVNNKIKNEFGEKGYYIFGHSFGGRVAIKLSVTKGKGSSLQGLILCSAGGITRGNGIKRNVFYVFAKIGKVLLLIPGVAKLFRKFLYRIIGEHDYEKTKGVMRQTFVNIVREELKEYIRKIQAPTLILWGDKDGITPVRDAYFIHKNLKGSKLIIYKDRTHNIPYKESVKMAKNIDDWVEKIKK